MKHVNKIWRTCVSIVSAVLIVAIALMSAPQPALADGLVDTEQEYTVAIYKLQPFLSRTETGNIVLEPPEGLVSTIDSEIYQSVLSGLEMTNQMIDSGYLICEDDFSLTTTEKYQESVNQVSVYRPPTTTIRMIDYGDDGPPRPGDAPGDYGWTGVVWHWWGFHVYLDHWYVVAITGSATVGGLIAGLVPEPFASKAAAAILGIGAWVFASFDTYGKGIILHFTFIFPIFFAGISPQR